MNHSNFKGARLSWSDFDRCQDLEQQFMELCERISDKESKEDKNLLRIKRRAIGERILRCMLSSTKEVGLHAHNSRVLTKLEKGAVVDGEMMRGLDVQGAVVDGLIPCRNEKILYMLTIADKAGIIFVNFYHNLLDAQGADDLVTYIPNNVNF